MTNLIIRHLIARPTLYLYVSIACILLGVLFLTGIKNDPNPEILPLSHASRVLHEKIKTQYTGTKDNVVVLLQTNHADGVFNPATLARIDALSRQINEISVVTDTDLNNLKNLVKALPNKDKPLIDEFIASDDVAKRFTLLRQIEKAIGHPELSAHSAILASIKRHLSPVIQINSLVNTDNILSDDDMLLIEKAFEVIPSSAAALNTLSKNVSNNRLFQNLLLSDDKKSTAIFIEIDLKIDESKAAFAFYRKIKQIIDSTAGDEYIAIAGTPVTTANIANIIDKDMGKLFPLVLLLVVGMLWLNFKMARGIAIPVLVVVGAIIITLGIQAAFGIPVNVISSALPVFLLSIGVADGIHIYSEFKDHRESGQSVSTAVSNTLKIMCWPVITTSLTTAFAFWSLAATEIVQIKHFGLFVGIGTLVAMVLSLLFIPALLLVLKPNDRAESKSSTLGRYLTSTVSRLTRLATARARTTLATVAILVAVALPGFLQVGVDNNRVAFFKKDSEIFTGAQALNSQLAGTETINLILSSQVTDTFKQPEIVAFIDELESDFANHALVGKTTSIAGLLSRMNLVLNNNAPSFDSLKDLDKNSIAQFFLLYENSGGTLLSDFVNFDYSEANIRFNLKTNSSNDVRAIARDIQAYLDARLPAQLDASLGGSGMVLVSAGDEIIYGQLNSFAISLVVVFVFLLFGFKNPVHALIGTLPLLLASYFNFALMGALNISLDIGTAIISSIAVGVGVDFSIHYISRLKRALSEGYAIDKAIEITVKHSGKAIAANALTVGCGFLALLASGFIPINTIGILVSLTMLSSCAFTLVLIPACFKWLYAEASAQYAKTDPASATPPVASSLGSSKEVPY